METKYLAPEENPELVSTLLSFVNLDGPWAPFYTMTYTPEIHEGHMKHHIEFRALVEKYAHLSAPERTPLLLDVGTGTGAFPLEFSQSNYDVVAIDNDPIMVAKAMEISKRLGGFAKILCMDANDLILFKEQSFDVAFSQGTLEHFTNEGIHNLIKQQLRVAKYVIFSMPSRFYPHRDYESERRMTVDEWNVLLHGLDAKVLYLSYYTKDKWHVVGVLTSV